MLFRSYTDGLKIYTTIDSRMQKYAEEAMHGHVEGFLQPMFNREKRNSRTAPFSNASSKEQEKAIIDKSIKQSDRYRTMKNDGYSENEIKEAFKKPVQMTVFTPHGEVDTIMTPYDSIRYYKSFLRSGFMVIDPHNGNVKAYVGGLNYTHFQYDMCTAGRRDRKSVV